jgi:predicted Fe-Mo cluster-binding NifX family protein
MLTLFAMRIAIPHWQGRIAPVFDVAGHLLLADLEGGRVAHRQEKALIRHEPTARVSELVACGVELLICGAISARLQLRIAQAGIRVVAFLCGTVDEVLSACLNGTLSDSRLAMPGCRRWRWRGGDDGWPEETVHASSTRSESAVPSGCGLASRRREGKGRTQPRRSQWPDPAGPI